MLRTERWPAKGFKSEKGFTLPEILVAIVVFAMAVMAVMAVLTSLFGVTRNSGLRHLGL